MKIVEVTQSQQLKSFLDLPKKIYASHSFYTAPLKMHIKMMLGPLNEQGKLLLLAINETGEIVARLAVKVHDYQHERWLHFGFFESLPNQHEAVSALFDYAQKKYPDRTLKGPYHFTMEDPYVGNLVHGFKEDPIVFMPYCRDYYDELLQSAGLEKSMDLQTFLIQVTECPKQIQLIAQRTKKRGASVRWLNPKKLKEEVHLIANIFNDALSENWGFEPITEVQLEEMFLLFKYLIDARLVCFLVKDEKEIGCLILLPNFNPLIKKANGRLSLSFIWNFFRNRKKYESIRGYALGMRKGFEGTGNVCLMLDEAYRRAIDLRIKECEISWVLENNRPMTELSQSLGGKHNKTYRVYEKSPH